jgi:ribosomal protein S16
MRFYKYIEETTVVGDVAKNLAKGEVDVIGAPKYKKKKKKTRLDRRPIVVHESSVSSAVVGSQQTRVWSDDNDQEITVLKRQPRPLKFMERVGAYLPPDEEVELKEDYFEVTVEYAAMDGRARTETWDITDAKNKKQAEKKAHGLFKVEFGKDGYRITKIKREKGNPGVTDKSPSEFQRERDQRERNRR